METISVIGAFVDQKKVNKETLMSTWYWGVKDLRSLCETDEEFELVELVQTRVKELAERDFYRILRRTQK